jgi:hypothetical protein
MASSQSIYQLYTDEIARSATITIETGVDPGDTNYAPASLVDENPAKVAKIDSTTGAWLFDHGSAVDLQLVALIHHNFDAGANVKIQRDATNSWGAPSFEQAFTIPTWLGSGESRWPVNPWLDLTSDAQYDAGGWRYTRIVVTSNSQNLQLGEVWLGSTIRRLTPGIRYGFEKRFSRPLIENRTAYGVSTIYTRGTRIWRLGGDRRLSTGQIAALEAHWENVEGRVRPWLFIPDSITNESGAYLVRYQDTDLGETFGEWQGLDQRFVIEEVGRGLRPGT